MLKQTLRLVLLPAAAAVLVACGGGGGGGTGPSTVDTLTLSGIAATGAAFVGAEVAVTDKTGEIVGKSAPVGNDGKFKVTVSTTTQAPYVLTASRTTANGEVQSLVSVSASTEDSLVNVTPITHLIASRLSPSGDPSKLSTELAASNAVVTNETISQAVGQITTVLEPLLEATGTQTQNLLSENFSVDGTGIDRLLDSIKVSVVPFSPTASNVSVSVKQALAEGEQPPTINFQSNASDLPTLPVINAQLLVENGTAVKVSNLMRNLTACFAVPFEDRVNGVTSSSTLVVTGGAADVKASKCKDLFLGKNPANYLSNGARVGRDVNNIGAFSGLFRRATTNSVFSDGAFEYSTTSGDLIISYKSVTSAGIENTGLIVARKNSSGELELVGNGYQFPGGVAAFHQRRNFISLNQSNYDYHNTGYAINVANINDQDGNPLFNRVVVTSPRNDRVFVLRPNGGISFLTLTKDDNPNASSLSGTLSPTNVVRLRSEYIVEAPAKSHPRIVDNSLVFSSVDWTEKELTDVSDIGAWKFEYYLSSSPGVVASTQYFRTRTRALSIAEIKEKGFASFTRKFIKQISESTELSGTNRGRVVLSGGDKFNFKTVDDGDGWIVEGKQLPPILISTFGRIANNGSFARFNDEVGVSSTDRKGAINCSPQNIADVHCSNGGPGYAAGAAIDSLQLFTRDSKGSEFGSLYGMYPLNLP